MQRKPSEQCPWNGPQRDCHTDAGVRHTDAGGVSHGRFVRENVGALVPAPGCIATQHLPSWDYALPMAVHNPHTRTHAVFLAALRSAPPPGDDFDRGNHRSRPLEVGLCDDDVTAHDPATSTVHATAAANPGGGSMRG